MNRFLVTTALKLIPYKLQQKALCKALNFLFKDIKAPFTQGKTFQLGVTDFKKRWFVSFGYKGFEPQRVEQADRTDVFLEVSFDTVLNCRRRSRLLAAIQSGDIVVSGAPQESKHLLEVLKQVEQPRLDALVTAGCSFLRIKPAHRIDLSCVTIEDVECQQDIDYLRDEAMKREASDLSSALRLMEVAYQGRPDGPLIKRKVRAYRKALAC